MSDTTKSTDRLRSWAAEQLELPDSADARALDSTFLKALDEAELVPPDHVTSGYFLLRHPQLAKSGAAPLEFLAAEEQSLIDDVARFASGLFAEEPHQREQTFRELFERCESCQRAMQHLTDLRAGLDINFASLSREEEPVQELANHVRELFILRPEARGRRRCTILARLNEDKTKWRGAADQLRRSHPEIAALDAPLLDALAYIPPSKQQIKRQRRKSQKAAVASGEGGGWAKPLLVFWVGFVILRGLSALNSSSNTTPDYKDKYRNLDIDGLDIDLESPALRELLKNGVKIREDGRPKDERAEQERRKRKENEALGGLIYERLQPRDRKPGTRPDARGPPDRPRGPQVPVPDNTPVAPPRPTAVNPKQ